MIRIVPIDWSPMRARKMRRGVTTHRKSVPSMIVFQSIGVFPLKPRAMRTA